MSFVLAHFKFFKIRAQHFHQHPLKKKVRNIIHLEVRDIGAIDAEMPNFRDNTSCFSCSLRQMMAKASSTEDFRIKKTMKTRSARLRFFAILLVEAEMTTAEKLVKRLTEAGKTCGTAESCTGGGVGSAITSVAGSSTAFWGGIISYDNSVKRDVLGVPEYVLNTKGAVSPECAAAMAEGARRILKTDFAVSLTGIAGPGGGSAEKPVGLVWFGLASSASTKTEHVVFPGERNEVRKAAVEHALTMLLDAADGR